MNGDEVGFFPFLPKEIQAQLYISHLIMSLKLGLRCFTRAFSALPRERVPRGYTQATPAKDDLVIVAMSSGVDSSVAASLYAKHPNVKGLFMSNWNQLDSERCLEEDWKDVQEVAKQLQLPVEMVNFEKDYWIDVFEPMINDYSKGITPNPDINCNRYVKFGRLVDYLEKTYQGQKWWLVTGHYSRVLEKDGEPQLMRSYYKQKDQSYYLSQIRPEVLPRLLLPIGHFTKPEVREMAKDLDLPVADKPDSTGLCFVNPSQQNFHEFLKNFITETPGNIVTEDGKVWGKHDGLWSYTIGQKLGGISLPQGDPRYKGTWFISEKNFQNNDITIVRGVNNEKLFKHIVYLAEFESLVKKRPLTSFPIDELRVQYRSLQEPIELEEITQLDTGKFVFKLKEKKRAIAPGQYLCIYHGDRCLGSGVIEGTE